MLVHEAEAVSVLKLKNGNDDSVFVDGSSLEDAVAGIGMGAMNGNSPTVTTMMWDVIIRQVVVLGANACIKHTNAVVVGSS
jgi:hypothetical protein